MKTNIDTRLNHIAQLQVMIEIYGLHATARMVFEAKATDPGFEDLAISKAVARNIRQATIEEAIEREGFYSVLEDVSLALDSVANKFIDDDTTGKSAILEWEKDVFGRLMSAFDLNEEADGQEQIRRDLAGALISAAKIPGVKECMDGIMKERAEFKLLRSRHDQQNTLSQSI